MALLQRCPTKHRNVANAHSISVEHDKRSDHGGLASGPGVSRYLVEVGICRDCGYTMRRFTQLGRPGAWRMIENAQAGGEG